MKIVAIPVGEDLTDPLFEPVELGDLPDLLDRGGNRCTVSEGEYHLRGTALHDLMQHERRQVIQQVYVIDAHDHLGA